MSKSFNFNEMAAFEFSALTQKNPDSISKVTVLDCKHCNYPAPREDFAVFAKKNCYLRLPNETKGEETCIFLSLCSKLDF